MSSEQLGGGASELGVTHIRLMSWLGWRSRVLVTVMVRLDPND
jgi:hypothetical protein